MGQPKALLPFDDRPLIAHVVETLRRLFDDIVVVAAPGQDVTALTALPVTVVRDRVAYQGPVGGISYGLSAAAHDVCFVTACDSAFLNPALIAHLVERIAEYDVVVPVWEQRLQPLHAVYRRHVQPLLEQQLARGELRPVFLFDRVRTCRVGEDEIRAFDRDGWSLFNMNTPDDYARALDRWRETRGAAQVPCTVELFGVARLVARMKEVAVTVPAGATCSDVFAALAHEVPGLVGRVISPDRRSLVAGYATNVNGRDFVRSSDTPVTPGDRIIILSADAGG